MTRTEQHYPVNVERLSEHQFISRLCDLVNAGFGIVPFLGSGCSSSSGIMMGKEFTDYLAYTIFVCVASKKVLERASQNASSIPQERWDLRRQGWPQSPKHEAVRIARRWVSTMFQELCNRCDLSVYSQEDGVNVQSVQLRDPGTTPDDLAKALNSPLLPPFLRGTNCEVNQNNLRRLHALLGSKGLISGGYLLPGISPTSEDAIIERAIRSLYDWRSTLQFLSELQLIHVDRHSKTLILTEADSGVIDGFNVHITRGHMPNLAHTMFCHLSRPARMRIFLTTNFDSLIEQAFTEQGYHLEEIPVSIKGTLPDPEIVHARDTVVKMHGTLWETRADFSLDESPPLEDKRRFFKYIRGFDPVANPGLDDERYIPQHLLVCGYSGSDNRCIEMIKYVLDCDPRARIYWVCYSESDLRFIDGLFREQSYRSRVVTVVTERLDLLLYEWYQKLCLCLPANCGSHQLIHNVPPGSSFRPAPIKEKALAPGAAMIIDKMDWLSPEKPKAQGLRSPHRNRLIVVDGPSGILSATRDAFDELATRHGLNKIWLELEDYPNAACLGHEIFQLIAIRLGHFQLEHCSPSPSSIDSFRLRGSDKTTEGQYQEKLEKAHANILSLCEHFGTQPKSWLLVLYGRNGPGGCSGWEEGNYWKEDQYGDAIENKGACPGEFSGLLSVLITCGFNIIYVPYSESRENRDQKRLNWLKAKFPLQPQTAQRHPAHTNICRHEIRILKAWHYCKQSDAVWAKCTDDDIIECDLKQPIAATLTADNQTDHNESPGERRLRQIWNNWINYPEHDNQSKGTLSQGLKERRIHERKTQLTLLYASTLFRQSRHYSAFLSEAVYRCPNRYNVHGIDNDLTRAELIESKLVEFNEQLVFFRKPGGFAWAYRDMRYGLRWLLEHYGEEHCKKSGSKDGIRPPQRFRCRTHYHIGDWYYRASLTSGHAVPLMEALYHFCQSAFHAHSSDKYGVEYWIKSAHMILRCLRSGGASLRFWFDKSSVAAWFERSDGTSTLLSRISLTEPEKIKSTWKGLKDFIRSPLAERGQNVSEKDRKSLSESLCDLEKGVRSKLSDERYFRLLQQIQLEEGLIRKRARLQFRIHNHSRYAAPESTAHSQNEFFEPANIDKESLSSFFDRNEATSNPTTKAENFAKAVVNKLDNRNSDLRRSIDEENSGVSNAWSIVGTLQTNYLLTQNSINNQAELFDDFQHLVEWAFSIARHAKRRDRILGFDEYAKESSETESAHLLYDVGANGETKYEWMAVCILCSTSLDVAGYLDPTIGEFVAKECSKALAIYGLALARLNRFSEAHRRWNEAESILLRLDLSDQSVLRGIIELRRAEGYILEARRALRFATASGVGGKHCGTTFRGELNIDPKTEGKKISKMQLKAIQQWMCHYCGFETDSSIPGRRETLARRLTRVHLAKLGDAWRCLENAQRFFAGKTHSPRWWGRLYGLQLRCYAEQASKEEVRKLCFRTDSDDEDSDRRSIRTLVFRIKKDIVHHLGRLLDRGLVTHDENEVHPKLTLLDYTLRALAKRDLNDVRINNDDSKRPKTVLEVMLSKLRHEVINGGKADPSLSSQYRKTLKSHLKAIMRGKGS